MTAALIKAKGPNKALLDTQEIPMKIWCMIGMLLFTLISHNALASEVPEDVYLPHFLKKDTIEAFMQRHLTVVPPKEWESRPLDESSPYYYGCTRYVLREGGITVLACPMMDQMVFDQPGTLEALMEDAVRLGRSVVRYGSWGLDIWIPLKEGKGGGQFSIRPTSTAGAAVLKRTRPMLEAFKSFDVPKELLAPDIDPLRYVDASDFPIIQQDGLALTLDGITLMRESGKDENGQMRFIKVTIAPFFPIWGGDMPECLELLCYGLRPDGKHWKGAYYGDIAHVAKSHDGRALAILREDNKNDATTRHKCMDALDKFVW